FSSRIVHPSRRSFAQQMRRLPTEAENRMWQLVRAGRLGGLKFRRQEPIAGFIVDFVCFERRLIVEVDGGQHSESAADALRDERLAALGFATLRFWNDDVLGNPEDVAIRILEAAGKAI